MANTLAVAWAVHYVYVALAQVARDSRRREEMISFSVQEENLIPFLLSPSVELNATKTNLECAFRSMCMALATANMRANGCRLAGEYYLEQRR